MSGIDKRLDARIPCEVPLRLQVNCEWLPVTLVDVSRTGARLRLPLGALGLGPGLGLAEIAEHLERQLPPRITLQFHPERLGTLVCRRAKIVHLSVEGGLPHEIEVGCTLGESLSQEEAAALGLPLPGAGESAEDALRKYTPQPPQPRVPSLRDAAAFRPLPGSHWFSLADEDRPSAPLQARAPRPGSRRVRILRSDGGAGDGPEPLLGTVECVDGDGCVVRVPEPLVLRITGEQDDVRRLTVSLCDAYGPEARLELDDDGGVAPCRRLASIQRVEMAPDHPGELRVGFTFCDDGADAA